MEPILFATVFVGFFVTLFFLPIWIKRAKKAGLTGRDINKNGENDVAESGGINVLLGFILGVLSYVAIKTFYFQNNESLAEIFVLLCVVLIVAFVGLMDDILGWKIGLSRKVRVFFLFFAAIPLMVINAGESTMMGIDFGLYYPLLLIPIGIVGVTSTFNFLAGFNGLESSQGIIILSALSYVSWITGNSWISLMGIIMVSCLIPFYIFNKTPAKVFPGDVLTYSVGALIGIMAILGNMEKIAIFFFIPYILEVVLKLRGKLKKESFGKVKPDGSLGLRYDKLYGLTHVSIYLLGKIKKKVYEQDVVYLINGFQMVIILIGVWWLL